VNFWYQDPPHQRLGCHSSCNTAIVDFWYQDPHWVAAIAAAAILQ